MLGIDGCSITVQRRSHFRTPSKNGALWEFKSILVLEFRSTELSTHLDDHSVSYHVKRWPGDFLTDVKHPLQLTSVGVR